MRAVFLALLTFLITACSLPPQRPITMDELMATRIYSYYEIEESPEEILRALNEEGEVIVAGKRIIRDKVYPVHIKLLATSGGIEVSDYDR